MELVFFEPQKNQKSQSRVLGIVSIVPFVVQNYFYRKILPQIQTIIWSFFFKFKKIIGFFIFRIDFYFCYTHIFLQTYFL
jgi:hypothetical protein